MEYCMTLINLQNLIEDPQNDIVVWSYRNNYTSYRNPDMYSWLDVDGDDIKGVSVKKFPGGNPVDEYAIVGTMFFRNKDVYLQSLKQNIRKECQNQW
ncbi:MAG: hypothetical protein CM15mV24_1080 [Bellamyvirus sp.]|nr:MAG: hypothetical protein CM15mV24_1080 [Bellamyvirus sp.]